jgi:hypothetical protein
VKAALLFSGLILFCVSPAAAAEPAALRAEIYTDAEAARAGEPFYVYTRVKNLGRRPLEFMLYEPHEHWEVSSAALVFTEVPKEDFVPAKIILRPGEAVERDLKLQLAAGAGGKGVKFRMRFRTKPQKRLFSDAASGWSNELSIAVAAGAAAEGQ